MGYRYIGSKARIANDIVEYINAVSSVQEGGFFIDAFSGTGVVAERAAQNGWPIYINDMLESAIIMSEARLLSVSDVSFDNLGGYERALDTLNALPGQEGFIWQEYSPASAEFHPEERKYFTESNAKKIDAISSTIHAWESQKIISRSECVLLLSDLMRAVNNIANIAGTYGCFLSHWLPQANKELFLERSELKQKSIKYKVSNLDVFALDSSEKDIMYLDPPYTKRQYASYYHILETLAHGDHPQVSGISGLRPWKEKSSVFCYKSKALSALTNLILKQKAKRIFLSYSNEGHIHLEDLMEKIVPYGNAKIVEIKTIGRYRPNKVAVEKSSHVSEYLIDFSKKW